MGGRLQGPLQVQVAAAAGRATHPLRQACLEGALRLEAAWARRPGPLLPSSFGQVGGIPLRSAQGPEMNNCCPVERRSWLQPARQLKDEDRRTIDRGWDNKRHRFPSHFNLRFEYAPSAQQRM